MFFTSLLTTTAILADVDRFQAMRGGLKPGRSADYTSQIILVVVIAVVVAAVFFAVRYFNARRSKPCYAPLGLFHELCKAHGLNRSQQRLLVEVAEELALEHPSRLFLEPHLFEQANSSQTGERRSHIDALRVRLFSDHLDLLSSGV